MSEKVSIVGGGVIGVTTGIFLELEGYDTRIYTEKTPYEDIGVHSLATNYAAASVMHSVAEVNDLSEAISVSNSFYSRLEDKTDAVRRQDDLELYEGEGAVEPDHADALMRYRTLNEYDGTVPTRDGATEVGGYVHEIFFVEMPSYVPELRGAYLSHGGDVVRRRVEKDEVPELGGDIVVNATGYGNLFDDDGVVARRGHLVNVDTDGRLRDENGDDFSYTYYLEDGDFVYAYPREDCLLLGGSDHEGDEVDGEWVGKETDDAADVGGEPVPRRIPELNRELVEAVSGVDIEGYDMRGRYGYRPYRKGGVRTEKEEYGGKEVVHCYGHGGSGVTLSWYSANLVYNLISGSDGFEYGVLDGFTLGRP